jgi:hypothetical protein
MLVSVPLLLLLSFLVWSMYKHGVWTGGRGLTIPEFLVCSTWGFLLAHSMFAPMVQAVLDGLGKAVHV